MRLLFVPVSGPRGMGEYARCLAIATAAARRWPEVEIHFVLSREAPYAAETPFSKTLLASSPTFHSSEMTRLIRDFRPTVVLFDNAGRTAQLRAAAEIGARIIFVSSRRRPRHKAFRLQWMRMLDEHWIAYPQFVAGPPGPLERLKLRMLGSPTLRYLDAILPQPDAILASATLAKYGLRPNEYVLVVPGGGTAHRGSVNAPQIVADAALRIAARGTTVILVGVPSPAASDPRLHVTTRLPMGTLAELMRGAKLVVANGGDTLLQALACRRACVAVPIAGDQPRRIAKCVEAGAVVAARLEAGDIEARSLGLLENDAARHALEARLAALQIKDGVQEALASIERLHRLR